jgi:ubiquinone/menaquinone biosynthesis C-methylase UbiE
MRDYYEARAPDYDEWWLGLGRAARGGVPAGWADDVAALVSVVASLPPARVLDVACGTGFLTQHLRGEVVALDQSVSMVSIAARRLPEARVVQGEAVPLPFGDDEFDRVFTSHFYGHLLPDEREPFLAEARRVAKQLVVVDAALNGRRDAEEWQERTLRDGSRYLVYKRFFTGEALVAELGGGHVLHEGRSFLAVCRDF